MHALNIIGCGKVGKTLGTLFLTKGLVSSVTIVNRSAQSGSDAVSFLGSAQYVTDLQQLPPARVWMIAAPDKELPAISRQLASLTALNPEALVFHCCGSKDSSLLSALEGKTSKRASLHLIRSFADPAATAASFDGTYCGIEGSPEATSELSALMTAVGATVFPISAEATLLCHIGHVFASNYLVVILDCARTLYSQAAIPEGIAKACMHSIVEGTLRNIASLGTTQALTGPIVRGECELLQEHLSALRAMPHPALLQLYTTLAQGALEIAKERSDVELDTIAALREIVAKY